jgi:hypothetical protein
MPLLKLVDQNSDGTVFRWDNAFLMPANSHAQTAMNLLTLAIAAAPLATVALVNTADTLVVDNWRTRATGLTWTVERLMRSVRRFVGEGLVDRKVLAKAPRPPHRRSEELAMLMQGLALTNPRLSLRGIGGQLEAMKIRTPAGKSRWAPASVAHLLKRVIIAPAE